jgi:hypothetical protein
VVNPCNLILLMIPDMGYVVNPCNLILLMIPDMG